MRRRVEFRLTMSTVKSWDGRWSGEGCNYTLVRKLTPEQIDRFTSWTFHHHFSDGWVADVHVREMQPGERTKKSDGFCGYEWMIDNVLEYGRTEACLQESDHNWQPEREGWERCPRCRTSRRVHAEDPLPAP